MISTVLTLVLIIVLWGLIHQIVIKPTRAISSAMVSLRTGDAIETIPCIERRDEIGRMARSLDVFHQNMAASFAKIENQNKELKNLIQALETAEEKFRLIFENAAEGIFQISPQGFFINANPAMAAILGYDSVAELVDGVSNVAGQCYAHHHDFYDIMNQVLETGGVKDVDVRVKRKNQEMIWASQSMRAFPTTRAGSFIMKALWWTSPSENKKRPPNGKRKAPRRPPRPKASFWPT